MQDPTTCLQHFLEYAKYIMFFVLHMLSMQILNLVAVAKHTKDVSGYLELSWLILISFLVYIIQ